MGSKLLSCCRQTSPPAPAALECEFLSRQTSPQIDPIHLQKWRNIDGNECGKGGGRAAPISNVTLNVALILLMDEGLLSLPLCFQEGTLVCLSPM